MVVALAPLLCIFKAFLAPAQNLLESSEKQRYVIIATVIAGIVDISVAWYFIPAHGAVGACFGNGAAQLVAVVVMWAMAIYLYKVKLPWLQVAKIAFISALASLTAHYFAVRLAPLWAILCGGCAALAVLFTLFYWMRVLEPEDHDRFKILSGILPKLIAGPVGEFLPLLIRAESVRSAATSKYISPRQESRLFSAVVNVYRKILSSSVRQRVLRIRKNSKGIALKLKLSPIPVEACLQGGDNGIPAATFARMVGDIRRASRPISEWPQVKLLRQYDAIGEQIWERDIFQNSAYYQNAVLNIEIFGRYFDAIDSSQIEWGARRFVNAYRGEDTSSLSQEIPSYDRDPYEFVAVQPIKDSSCYQVSEGHHRLAIAYVKGIPTVSSLILRPPVTTPIQEMLLDVLWLRGSRQLCQPIDSPEVVGWVLLRRCSDRLAKMTAFLRAEGLMPPACVSYLDVASSYGWFVAEMTKSGFQAEGVERDPTAISVGQAIYGLMPEQVHRSDAVNYLRSLQKSYDVTSCLGLAHLYILNRLNASPEELLHLMDAATRRVMFFEMAQGHEYPEGSLAGWNPDHIHRWLEANTTFKRIVRLGVDEDACPPKRHSFGRMLFACVR